MNRLIRVILLVTLITPFACKEKEADSLISADQNAAIEAQSVTEAYFNEAGDLSAKAFNTPSGDEIAGGRTRGTITITVEGDNRFNGAVVTLVTDVNSSATSPKGVITIDFAAGQTDPRGNVRKGKILVAYEGIRFIPGSTSVITFDGYEINGVKITGTRTITNSTLSVSPNLSVTFTVEDADGVATFPDQTTITRNATHIHRIDFGSTLGSSTWTVKGQANGTTRTGADYVFLITRDLIFKAECAFTGFVLPSEGAAVFTVDDFPIILNYGDENADCDNTVTVSINGLSQDVTVND